MGGRAAGIDGAVTSCCVRKVLSPSASCDGSPAVGRAFDCASRGVGSRAGTLGLETNKRTKFILTVYLEISRYSNCCVPTRLPTVVKVCTYFNPLIFLPRVL